MSHTSDSEYRCVSYVVKSHRHFKATLWNISGYKIYNEHASDAQHDPDTAESHREQTFAKGAQVSSFLAMQTQSKTANVFTMEMTTLAVFALFAYILVIISVC